MIMYTDYVIVCSCGYNRFCLAAVVAIVHRRVCRSCPFQSDVLFHNNYFFAHFLDSDNLTKETTTCRNDITTLASYDRHGSDSILSPQCNS